MTQHKPPQAMTLFDLIARSWEIGTGIRRVLFNGKGTAVTAVLEDGRLAFVSVKDAESPDSRVRVEADTGRSSIRPRSKDLPPPVISDAPLSRLDVAPCRFGDQGVAYAHADSGALWRATARGQALAVRSAPAGAVTALAALPRSMRLAVALGSRLALLEEAGGAELAAMDLPHDIAHIAVSDDEKTIACCGAGQISLVATDDLAVATIACAGDLLDLQWSPCGRWLVAGCADNALLLVDAKAGTSDRIVDFPAAVHTVGFSTAAQAMVASGAFRVVGWTLPDLPFGDHAGTPFETGKPGLTLVDRVAVHPSRDLCAVGYGTGLVMLCRIGHPDEMLVREGTGHPVNALAWSDDGAHLAIGDDDGDLSIATFPKSMFK